MGQGSIKNMNFSFLGQVFQYWLLGFKACQLRFASYSNIVCWVSMRVYWGSHHEVLLWVFLQIWQNLYEEIVSKLCRKQIIERGWKRKRRAYTDRRKKGFFFGKEIELAKFITTNESKTLCLSLPLLVALNNNVRIFYIY